MLKYQGARFFVAKTAVIICQDSFFRFILTFVKAIFIPFVFCLFSARLFCQTLPTLPVNPPEKIHPRLLFTEEKLSQIKENLHHPENLPAFTESEKILAEYFGKESGFTSVKKRSFRWSGKLVAAIEAAAFKYALTREKKYCDWAYKTFLNCCNSIDLTGIYDDYRPYGQMILTAAEIYDWAYSALSEKEKAELYKQTVSFMKKLQIGYPPLKGKSVTGHSAEGQLLRAYLAAAISMYDEHKDLWEMSASRFYSEFVPARLFFYESHAPNFQGTGYGPYRSIFDLWACLMIKAMGAEEPYQGKAALWSHYFLYNIRPDKMTWHIGDDHSIEKMTYNSFRYTANAILHYSLSKDPYAKFFAREGLDNFTKFKYNENGENDELLTPVQFLIFNDVALLPLDYKNLPSLYYAPSPLGEYFAFSAWDGKNVAALHLKIGEYAQANHEHQDAGSFEIFCNGLLASTAGFYVSGGGKDKNGGYRAEHTQKFYHSSVSKNTILLQLTPDTYEGYGLQRPLPEAKNFEQILSDRKYKRATITARYDNLKDGKGLVFLAGDISNAYDESSFVHRSMLALFTGDEKKPLYFFVYDQVDSLAKGIFLLNTLSEPIIQENTITVSSGEERGSLKNIVLLPQSPQIKKIGGKGHQWEIAGKNYSGGSEKAVNEKSESGWGRVEISSSGTKNGSQTLFNAMEVFSGEKGLLAEEIRLLQTEDFDIALSEEFALGFYKGKKKNDGKSENPAISLPEKEVKKAMRLVLCNLPAGKWTVNGKTYEVSHESKILIAD